MQCWLQLTLFSVANVSLFAFALKIEKTNVHGSFGAGKGLVFDIGLNRGDDTNAYLEMGYHVVAVEANPYYAQQALQKFSEEIRQGRLQVLNQGLSDRVNGTVDFYIPTPSRALRALKHVSPKFDPINSMIGAKDGSFHFDEAASMTKSEACGLCKGGFYCECKKIKVQTTTCSDLIAKFGNPHYLKIDIEGFDGLCMKDLAKLSCDLLPPYISFEEQSMHQNAVASSTELIELLSRRGYTWKISRQTFRDHSQLGTGPFGEDVVDYVAGKEWRAGSAVSKQANYFCWHESPLISDSNFCDVHGKLDRSTCVDGDKGSEQYKRA